MNENETFEYGRGMVRKVNPLRIILYLIMLGALVGGYLGIKDYSTIRKQVNLNKQNINIVVEFLNANLQAAQQYQAQLQAQQRNSTSTK